MGARLGVDVGTVRIGVAVSDPRRTIAVPLDTVARAKDGSDLRAIAAIAGEREVDDVVVGLPISLSGAEGPAAASVRAFAQTLADALAPLPVVLFDERLTTTSAHQMLHAAGRPGRGHRTVVDRTAAAILLQAVLDAESGQQDSGDQQDTGPGETVPPSGGPADRSDA